MQLDALLPRSQEIVARVLPLHDDVALSNVEAQLPAAYREQAVAVTTRARTASRLARIAVPIALAFALISGAVEHFNAAPVQPSAITTMEVPEGVFDALNAAPSVKADPAPVFGGNGTLPIGSMADAMINLLRGPVGIGISLLALLFGLFAGIASGDFSKVAMPMAFAASLYYMPEILRSIAQVPQEAASQVVQAALPAPADAARDLLKQGKYDDFLALLKKNHAASGAMLALLEAQAAALMHNAAQTQAKLSELSGTQEAGHLLTQSMVEGIEMAAYGAVKSEKALADLARREAMRQSVVEVSLSAVAGAGFLASLGTLAFAFSTLLRRRLARIARLCHLM